jgi:hypothetical protein
MRGFAMSVRAFDLSTFSFYARIMVERSPELSSLVTIYKTALEYKGNVLRTPLT